MDSDEYDSDEYDNFMQEDELFADLNNSTVSSAKCVKIAATNENSLFLTPDEIYPYMTIQMDQIIDMLAISYTEARLLLNHYKWKTDVLINAFLDGHNIFKIAGVPRDNDVEVVVQSDITTENISEEDSTCGICFQDMDTSDSSYLERCRHIFCNKCWTDYLTAKIEDSVGLDVVNCPASNCNAIVGDDKVLAMLSSSPKRITEKYLKLISELFIEHNVQFNWCPGVNCSLVLKVDTTRCQNKPLLCNYNHHFCGSCLQIWHAPIQCQLLKKWVNRSKDDLESVSWIMENARPCPNCKVNIEKNQGCNHMTCKKCKHEFCWICFEPVKNDHHCNKFTPRAALGEEQRFISVERFEHFKARYQNHVKSLMLEQKLFDEADGKIRAAEKCLVLTKNQTMFYKKAIIILSRAREVLIATYIFAYYSHLCPQLEIFEINQTDLELATEQLSNLLEKEFTIENYSTLRINIQNKADYCNLRKEVLLQHINEGFEKNWWNLQED